MDAREISLFYMVSHNTLKVNSNNRLNEHRYNITCCLYSLQTNFPYK